jgi:hypothetical protein
MKRNDIKGFIPVTLVGGKVVMVNISKIIDYGVYSEDNRATISFAAEYYYKVMETMEEISELMFANHVNWD